MNKNKKDLLNQEFDDMRLQVKWALEDLINHIDDFEAVFINKEAFNKEKQQLTQMLENISKL